MRDDLRCRSYQSPVVLRSIESIATIAGSDLMISVDWGWEWGRGEGGKVKVKVSEKQEGNRGRQGRRN